YAHQELPFEALVEELAPARDGRPPLFQAMLGLDNATRPGAALGDLPAALVEVETGAAKLDLTLLLSERAGRLEGVLEIDRELFDRATGRRLAAQLQALLAGLAAAPATPLSALPILDEGARHQVLAEWNDTAAAPAAWQPVHEAIARQAA